MGFSTSKAENALREAKKLREDLYTRVENVHQKYQNSFAEIDQNLKKKILRASACELSEMLDHKEATSTQILLVFIERTVTVGVKNNYVFDEMFEEAIVEAEICDKVRSELNNNNKKCWRPGMDPETSFPPFYGVPTSLKETMVVKHRQVHVGFVAKVNPLSDHDGLFVMMVRKMGFIPFVRSNVPQGCKTMDTNNNIFGYSKNPWNKERSCGGSSGGESGMVSSYSAPIGFGSDIGGSLRIPAAFTGLITLKPHNRYSKLGNCYYGRFSGGLPLKSELGPITRTVEDTILVHQFLCNPENYKSIPLEFQDTYLKYFPLDLKFIEEEHKMKIGVVRRFKTAQASKANNRAVQECEEIFKAKGHEVVDIDLGNVEKLYFFLVHLFTFDQKLHLFSEFKGDEPLTVEFKIFALLTKIPWFLKKIIICMIQKKEPRLAKMFGQTKPVSKTDIFETIYKAEKILCPQIFKIFALNKLDAIILPTFATPAPKHGTIGKLQYFYSFASVWNILCYPVGTVPVTLVKQDEQVYEDEFNDFYTRSAKKTLEGAEGLPVGVQVASLPNSEEKVLYLMKELEKEISFREKYEPREDN